MSQFNSFLSYSDSGPKIFSMLSMVMRPLIMQLLILCVSLLFSCIRFLSILFLLYKWAFLFTSLFSCRYFPSYNSVNVACGRVGSAISNVIKPFIMCNIDGCGDFYPTCVCPYYFDACNPKRHISEFPEGEFVM